MQRPPAITVFGILNIVFAMGQLAKLALSLFLRARALANGSALTRTMEENPIYAFWIHCATPLGLLSFALLLVTGVGLLGLREWARKLTIAYGVYAILNGVTMTAMTFVYAVAPLFARASFSSSGYIAPASLGIAVGAAMGGVLTLVYPVLLIVFMTRPRIIAAFRPQAQPPALPAN